MTIFNEIERDAKAGTQGDWAGFNMTCEGRTMTPEEIGEYVRNSVKMGDLSKFLFVSSTHDDGGDCDICHTGNGPKGEANTRRIANVPRYERAIMAAKELADAIRDYVYAETEAGDEQSPAGYEEVFEEWDRVEVALVLFREATK